MPLSSDEKQLLRVLLDELFPHDNYLSSHPTAESLALTERLLLEIQNCNRAVRRLLGSLTCSMISRGFLQRSLAAVTRLIRTNRHAFVGCLYQTSRGLKSSVWMSANGL
jgi:hypothetical protein